MSRIKNPYELAALATVAVPGLKVVAIRPKDSHDQVLSSATIVDSSGNKWTVTCPHENIGGLDLDSQATILGRLAQAYDHRRLPFDVPRVKGSTHTPEGDRVLVYPDLGGRHLTAEDFDDDQLLPASLGRALAALHNLPHLAYTGAGLPDYDAAECRRRLIAVLDQATTATIIPANLWNRWEAALDDVSLWRFPTAPIHADLQELSVIVDGGAVVAMSGFHNAYVGDPATDIAWILAQASDAFLHRFREAYTMERAANDIHLFTRAQLISELALVRWFVHGLNAEDKDIQADATTMIRELSEDLGDSQLVRHKPAPHSLEEIRALENGEDLIHGGHTPATSQNTSNGSARNMASDTVEDAEQGTEGSAGIPALPERDLFARPAELDVERGPLSIVHDADTQKPLNPDEMPTERIDLPRFH